MTEEKVHETGRGKIRIEIELSLNGQKRNIDLSYCTENKSYILATQKEFFRVKLNIDTSLITCR